MPSLYAIIFSVLKTTKQPLSSWYYLLVGISVAKRHIILLYSAFMVAERWC